MQTSKSVIVNCLFLRNTKQKQRRHAVNCKPASCRAIGFGADHASIVAKKNEPRCYILPVGGAIVDSGVGTAKQLSHN